MKMLGDQSKFRAVQKRDWNNGEHSIGTVFWRTMDQLKRKENNDCLERLVRWDNLFHIHLSDIRVLKVISGNFAQEIMALSRIFRLRIFFRRR